MVGVGLVPRSRDQDPLRRPRDLRKAGGKVTLKKGLLLRSDVHWVAPPLIAEQGDQAALATILAASVREVLQMP